MRKSIEVRRGNVVVNIYRTERVKGGKTYVNHTIIDYSSGTRKLRYAAELEEAKRIAGEIAWKILQGKSDVIDLHEGLRLEIRKALDALATTDLSILPAAQLLAQAVKILSGRSDELLVACQHWIKHRPDKPFTPKTGKDAATHYLAAQTHVSRRRYRNVARNLSKFTSRFGERHLHEVEAGELKNLVTEQKWNNKTRNEFLGVVGLLFKEAAMQTWVPEGRNPAKVIGRFKESRGAIGIFEPWEVNQMFSRLSMKAPELVPTLALWCFAGIRLHEISRLTWPEINRGLTTGFIEMEARKTKTNEPRAVPVSENLKAWLTLYRKDVGTIIPPHWLEATTSADDRLAELPRFIARKCGTVWKSNGPRHSFATLHLKLHKDAATTVTVMGTSLQKLQQHYWHKNQCVTEAMAKEYFGIMPEGTEKVVAMPEAATA